MLSNKKIHASHSFLLGFICGVHIVKTASMQCAFYELELILTKELTDTLCEKCATKQGIHLRYKMIL